jgi:hypothetical protein
MFRKISVAAFFLIFVLGAQEGRTASPPTLAQIETARQAFTEQCLAARPREAQCVSSPQEIARRIEQCYGKCVQDLKQQMQNFQERCSSQISPPCPVKEVEKTCSKARDPNACVFNKLGGYSSCSAYVSCLAPYQIPLEFLQKFV